MKLNLFPESVSMMESEPEHKIRLMQLPIDNDSFCCQKVIL